jgi:hypothetical protein
LWGAFQKTLIYKRNFENGIYILIILLKKEKEKKKKKDACLIF